MMSTRKKTADELREEMRKAEARVKELRAKIEKQTQLEQAQADLEVVKAVREIARTYQGGKYADNPIEMVRECTTETPANPAMDEYNMALVDTVWRWAETYQDGKYAEDPLALFKRWLNANTARG